MESGSEKRMDFRRTIPLLQGLHVLFSKKLQYLVKDSEHTLKSMNVPNGFGLDTKDEPENAVKDEDVEYNPGTKAKNQASKR